MFPSLHFISSSMFFIYLQDTTRSTLHTYFLCLPFSLNWGRRKKRSPFSHQGHPKYQPIRPRGVPPTFWQETVHTAPFDPIMTKMPCPLQTKTGRQCHTHQHYHSLRPFRYTNQAKDTAQIHIEPRTNPELDQNSKSFPNKKQTRWNK